MSNLPENERPLAQIELEAAAWVLRCDRGLTSREQDDFFQWLAANPQHGEQFARHRRHWNRVDALAQWRPEFTTHPNPDLLAPPPRRRLRRFLPLSLAFAAAAAIAAVFFVAKPPGFKSPPAAGIRVSSAADDRRVLEDGSIVELNRGAQVTVDFTGGERRVRLDQGEAHFTVTKDAARPFVVTAHGIDVRAIGTAFNVRLDAAVVEVLVTEGRVRVDSPHAVPADAPSDERLAGAPLVPVLEARQRAVVSLLARPEPAQIATLTPGEIERVLAWQHRLLDFTAAPLDEIVAEFNRRNVVQLILIDPDLGSVRLSASFRSDNIDGFVHLLEAGFGVKAEHRGGAEILLRKTTRSRPD